MLSIVQLSRFFVCVVLFKRQLVNINIAVFVCQELFLKSFMSFHKTNGEGGIWTLAPLLTTYSLSRGAPSASLGTSPRAERVGFEPTRPFGQTVFKTASLWPLRYLSKIPNCRFQQTIKLYRICDVDYSIIALHEMSTLFYHFFRFFFAIFFIFTRFIKIM